jgi:hypothetical protein
VRGIKKENFSVFNTENLNMQDWLTIAPIRNHWHIPEKLELPYQFDETTFLCYLPDWLYSSDEKLDLLLPKLREKIKEDELLYCVAIKYKADSLGAPDPDWEGDEPRSVQGAAAEKIRNVFIAFWLVRSSFIKFCEIAHIDIGPDRLIRQIENYYPICPLNTYLDGEYEIGDFEQAKYLYKKLNKLPLEGTLRTGIYSIMRALTEGSWELRFLILWLVLECVYGPEDSREITFRLSQRIAFSIGKNGEEASSFFVKIKDSYGWRSKVVHGLRLSKLTPEKSQELLIELEEIVRRSIATILSDEKLISIFDSKERESYLDSLLFR